MRLICRQKFEQIPDSYDRAPPPLLGKIVASKVPDIEVEMLHRIQIAEVYNKHLSDLSEVVTPRLSKSGDMGYLYYPISVPDREALMKHLISKGLDVAKQHIPNCANVNSFKRLKCQCPNAEVLAATTLTLPTYPGFSASKAREMATAIKSYLSEQ